MAAPMVFTRVVVFRCVSGGWQYPGVFKQLSRKLSLSHRMRKGLVLGIYDGEKENEFQLTKAAEVFQASKAANLSELIKLSGLASKKGKERMFYGLDQEYSSVSVASLGKKDVGYNELEQIEEGRENVRIAVGAGVRHLKDVGVKSVYVDPCGDPEAAAEAANLCVYVYDDLKTDEKKKVRVELNCFTEASADASSDQSAWERGTVLAQGQNMAKSLFEPPANVMTPTRFTEIAKEKLGGYKNVDVRVWDKEWAEAKKMGSFLSVSQGSEEPLKFLEVEYRGGREGEPPLAIVGKGITFDSGGISIKSASKMEDMRADMGGAACTLSAIYTAARLNLPINVMGFMPLCENMPGGRATKPGDVHTAMNGKSIQIDNTDAEGRLVLADALLYAETFKPRGILDMATLTGAVMVALGSSAAGTFTNSNLFWDLMHKAGTKTGDRVWRMPLFKHFSKQMTESHLADINNISTSGSWGGSCLAAAFLREFVTNKHWMHLDIAGVACFSGCKNGHPYMASVMSGRPTRTVVEFINALSKVKVEG